MKKILVTKTLKEGDAFLNVLIDGEPDALPVHPGIFRKDLKEGAELIGASLRFRPDSKGRYGLLRYDVVGGELRGERGLAIVLGKGYSK